MSDWVQIIIWWLSIQVLGWAALPLTLRLFRWLPDRGYPYAKALGLLVSSYILWMGATTGFLRNDLSGILASIFLLAGISIWAHFRGRNLQHAGESWLDFLRGHKRLVVSTELLFTLAFVAWAILRAYATFKIQPAGGEKFMEMAFLNGTLNSPRLPPADVWLSGFSISYYYFGYLMMAWLTRLTGALPGVGFDLYDALLFALTLSGVFGIVYNLVAGRRNRTSQATDGQAVRYGIAGALLVVVMGNLEGLLEVLHSRGLLSPSFWQWLNIPSLAEAPVSGSWLPGAGGDLWWWRASRVLADAPPTSSVNSITEFPFFSFLLGDNHPHVLALPYVLLSIALAFNLLRRQIRIGSGASEAAEAQWWNPLRSVFAGDWFSFFFYALILGALGFLNTWDMPIYIGLVALAYLAGVYARYRQILWEDLLRSAALAVALLVSAFILYFFFYIGFSSQAGGVLPFVFPPTRLPQYLVMFGPFIFILTWFLVVQWLRQRRQAGESSAIRPILSHWLGVVAASLGVYLLVLVLIFVTDSGRQMAQNVLNDPSVQAAVGELTLGQAFQSIIAARFLNPWLFVSITFLLGLVLANLTRYRRTVEPESESDRMQPKEIRTSSDLFAFVLIFVGLALTFSVEFFYLRDQFGVRMNTVFKFYYQGWMMLGIASAYGFWWLLHQAGETLKRVGRNLFTASALVLVLAGMVYPLLASYSRAAGFDRQPNLNGASEIASSNPDDWAAILWLRQIAATSNGNLPVILEAPGGSYTYAGRISAFSGLPAVLGWAGHEAQWRGTYTEQGKREPDIATIYTTPDANLALELLHKWDVRYVIVGETERAYIQRTCESSADACNLTRALQKFDTSLQAVFQQGETTIYEVPQPPKAP
jgi:YYY domain-containing protein